MAFHGKPKLAMYSVANVWFLQRSINLIIVMDSRMHDVFAVISFLTILAFNPERPSSLSYPQSFSTLPKPINIHSKPSLATEMFSSKRGTVSWQSCIKNGMGLLFLLVADSNKTLKFTFRLFE